MMLGHAMMCPQTFLPEQCAFFVGNSVDVLLCYQSFTWIVVVVVVVVVVEQKAFSAIQQLQHGTSLIPWKLS